MALNVLTIQINVSGKKEERIIRITNPVISTSQKMFYIKDPKSENFLPIFPLFPEINKYVTHQEAIESVLGLIKDTMSEELAVSITKTKRKEAFAPTEPDDLS